MFSSHSLMLKIHLDDPKDYEEVAVKHTKEFYKELSRFYLALEDVKGF